MVFGLSIDLANLLFGWYGGQRADYRQGLVLGFGLLGAFGFGKAVFVAWCKCCGTCGFRGSWRVDIIYGVMACWV